MAIFRNGVKQILSILGKQIISVNERERKLLAANPQLRYSHFVAQKALVMPKGQVSLREARFLGRLVTELKGEGPIVEVGTLYGWSTRIFYMFKNEDRLLLAVDNYSWNPLGMPPDMHYETARQILQEAIDDGDLQLLRMDSSVFFRSYSGPSPALVFIDSDHDYEAVMRDIEGARQLKAGTICGHDYDSPGVVQAVKECGGPSALVGALWVL